MVRDFRYSEEELTAGKNEITKLETDKKKQFVSAAQWLVTVYNSKIVVVHVLSLYMYNAQYDDIMYSKYTLCIHRVLLYDG